MKLVTARSVNFYAAELLAEATPQRITAPDK
jgi:hypothetical protein